MICIGVDAGGTSTHVALSKNGVLARETRAGAANATTIGVDAAAATIIAAVGELLGGAQPDAIHVGAAGAGRRATAEGLRARVAAAFPAARVTAGDDAAIALRAAIPHGDGAVLIAGTGSVAYAVHGERAERRGGLGHLAGDEGSAFWIGLQAVKLYGRVLDGRATADETTALVADALGASDRERFIAALYDAPLEPAAIASVAPAILALAGSGNRASAKIVQQAAQELGDLVRAVLKAVALNDASPAVAFAGGLLRENSLLSFLLETRLIGDVPGIAIVKSTADPVHGALRMAEALR
jgi:N-acetylglucosamine kinase-like BadF-type ATPase